MSHPTTTALPSDRARTLLRRLRDLNLVSGPVSLARGASVSIAGCLSLDFPAEGGVRYLLRDGQGAEGTLDLSWNGSTLQIEFTGLAGSARRVTAVPVVCDALGRACMPAIGARVRPDTTDRGELEHFLRRVVRALAR